MFDAQKNTPGYYGCPARDQCQATSETEAATTYIALPLSRALAVLRMSLFTAFCWQALLELFDVLRGDRTRCDAIEQNAINLRKAFNKVAIGKLNARDHPFSSKPHGGRTYGFPLRGFFAYLHHCSESDKPAMAASG